MTDVVTTNNMNILVSGLETLGAASIYLVLVVIVCGFLSWCVFENFRGKS